MFKINNKDTWTTLLIFGQLIKHKMRNIILEISYAKCGGEASLKLFFLKIKSKLWISGSTDWNIIQFAFIVCPSQDFPKCFYFTKSYFKKTMEGLQLVSLPHFQHVFLFLTLHSLNWPDFIVWLHLSYQAICALQLFVSQSVI